ncbi:unnamed protein product [Peronospora farinosa]|uniref:Uncharacterized protein n=1 Tax=Peronospora farinosa TaxID=134698 RepID=A0AAV0SZ61_9STRA|nr:unnamed protein product [Peronospora farinosa]CAI5711329.1 unnamed protein product [Peronospora farinosa]
MTGRKHAVPWLSWTEWHDVCVKLFSSDPYAQQHGVSRIASWRNRAQLPVAINATAQLLELQLHESMAQHHHHAIGVSSRSYMELSLLYSSIIVRCVNGLVDGSQKGAYALAVSTLAQRIGIPLWIVDLRHESTHNQLPSLSVLRFAARHLLAWLRTNYWEAQRLQMRRQVDHVSQWLFEQLPHLNRQLTDEKEKEDSIQEDITQVQIDLKPRLDVDTLRNIVVPLLVNGEHFDAPGVSTGLLFLEEPLQLEDKGSRDTTAIVQKDAFITLLLQLQPLWRSFSASLLARLCQKVFDAICTQKSWSLSGQGGELSSFSFGDQEKCTFKQNEVEMTLLWIKFMISSDYRERIKLQIGPIHDLCQCGAEMLALAENLQPDDVIEGREELLERLLAALRFSKAVKNHSTLAIEAAIATSLASESAIGWTQLPAWVESPIGLRYCYTSYESNSQCQVLEFSLDDDSLTPDSTTFVLPEDEEEEGIYDTGADDVMNALMEDLDAAYVATLQQTLDLQATIARDGLRQGGSAMVLPKQELQRIQEEIEIW